MTSVGSAQRRALALPRGIVVGMPPLADNEDVEAPRITSVAVLAALRAHGAALSSSVPEALRHALGPTAGKGPALVAAENTQ